MSLEKFKKITDNDHLAVLEHPDGHQITVAKGALSKQMRGQLDQLPLHMSQGGEVPKAPKIASNDDISFALRTLGLDNYSREKGYDEDQAQTPKTLEEAERMPASVLGGKASAGTMPSQAPTQQTPSLQNVNLGQTEAKPQINPALTQQTSTLLNTPAKYQEGLQQEAQGLATQGHEGQRAAQEYEKALVQEQQLYNKTLAENTQEYENFKQDYIKAHIKPNDYLDHMSSEGKIGTAIGMILGGIGGALAGQENAATKFLQQQIDRNIKAQEAELGKKHNLLSANLHRFKNIQDATQMTQAMLMGIMSAKFKEAEAKAMDPIAKGRAKQAQSEWEIKSASTLQELSQRQALLNGKDLSKIDPALLINALPKDQQENAIKDLQQYEDLRQFSDHALDIFDKVAKLNTLGNRITSPYQSHKQIDALLDPLIADLSKRFAGKFTEADAKAFRSAFKYVFQSDKDVSESRQNLVKIFETKMNPFAFRFSRLGIPLPGLKKKGNYIDKVE